MRKVLGVSAVLVLLSACAGGSTNPPAANVVVLPPPPNHIWVKTPPKEMVAHIKKGYDACHKGMTQQTTMSTTPSPDGSILIQVFTTEPVIPNTLTIVPQNGGSDVRFTGLDTYSKATLDIIDNWSVGKYVCK